VFCNLDHQTDYEEVTVYIGSIDLFSKEEGNFGFGWTYRIVVVMVD
jgi:hypothetical protein